VRFDDFDEYPPVYVSVNDFTIGRATSKSKKTPARHIKL
jgi:hypothetical protein